MLLLEFGEDLVIKFSIDYLWSCKMVWGGCWGVFLVDVNLMG